MKTYEEKCKDIRKQTIRGFSVLAVFAFLSGVGLTCLMQGTWCQGILLGFIFASISAMQCYSTLKSCKDIQDTFK
jgi:hypothetical protein